jgi:hypothetical protein
LDKLPILNRQAKVAPEHRPVMLPTRCNSWRESDDP